MVHVRIDPFMRVILTGFVASFVGLLLVTLV